MIRVLVIVLSLLLMNLQYHLWFGKGSYEELRNTQKAVEQQQQENAALKVRNTLLAAEVEDLKQGSEAIEERARMELGMIKEGEVFYETIE